MTPMRLGSTCHSRLRARDEADGALRVAELGFLYGVRGTFFAREGDSAGTKAAMAVIAQERGYICAFMLGPDFTVAPPGDDQDRCASGVVGAGR